jgi:hypothetical protein
MTNTTTLTPEAQRAVTALATARKMSAEAKKIEDAAKAVINEALTEAGAEFGTDNNGTVIVERVGGTNTSTDRTILAALYPEALTASTKTTPYTKLITK